MLAFLKLKLKRFPESANSVIYGFNMVIPFIMKIMCPPIKMYFRNKFWEELIACFPLVGQGLYRKLKVMEDTQTDRQQDNFISLKN
jgi:hypothetical protein